MLLDANQRLIEYPGMSDRDAESYARSLDVDSKYVLGVDSRRHASVPAGELVHSVFSDSQIYPGNTYRYTLYLPRQLDSGQDAPLTIFLDGDLYLDQSVNTPVVLDNLIHSRDIPPMRALFLSPGDVGPGLPIYGGTDNRSVEYDSITPNFSEFLSNELLPSIEGNAPIAPGGASRAICGMSSGGNASLVAAWHQPDQFGRVISHCGSFVNIRGADRLASLVRREGRRPIRVFLQTGVRDLDTVFGSWKIANDLMASALAYRNYPYQYVVGDSGHTLAHGAAILPSTLRWIWTDPCGAFDESS